MSTNKQSLQVIAFGKSDVGLRRTNNEDDFIVRPDLGLYVLADGMGGAAAGEIAGRIFTRTSLQLFLESRAKTVDEKVSLIEELFLLANRRILDHVQRNPDHQGMGCTGEALHIFENTFVLGHVGDSRTYLFRQGRLWQLTTDHSLVQEQMDRGLISQEEARRHPLRHVIYRAVGTHEELSVDLLKGEVMQGDIFLICSDGLTDMVEDDQISEFLRADTGAIAKAESLISSAKAAGGFDNVTVIVCEVFSV